MKPQFIITSLALVVLFSAARSLDAAPADPTETTTTPKPQDPTTTQPAPSSDQPAADSSSPAPAPEANPDASASPEKPVDQATQTLAGNLTTSFTCYGRPVGYYADVERSCKVYHFCLLGDYNNERVYQRITYLCMHQTVFDQQSLDCLEPSKVTSPCSEAPNHYGTSNDILRKAIIESKMQQDQNGQLAATAPAATTSN